MKKIGYSRSGAIDTKSMKKIESKQANRGDGIRISKIIKESFSHQAKLLNISELEYPNYVAFETEEMAVNRINNTQVKILYVDGEPIGTIGSRHKDNVGSIERLAILPAFRRRDYGKLLMEEAESELFDNGCKVIHISIVAKFEKLQKYYESLGYQSKDKINVPSLPFELLSLSKHSTMKGRM